MTATGDSQHHYGWEDIARVNYFQLGSGTYTGRMQVDRREKAGGGNE
ncbi:MAG: hypothetical protein ACTSU5_02105 [Promethearchaeota archaeon]